MDPLKQFFQGIVASFQPAKGIAFARSRHPGRAGDLLILSFLHALPLLLIVWVAAGVLQFLPIRDYVKDFPEFRINNGRVENNYGCDHIWTEENSGFTVEFHVCNPEAPADPAPGTLYINRDHFFFREEGGQIHSWEAGTFGDLEFSLNSVLDFVQKWSFPISLLLVVVGVPVQMLIYWIGIMIVSFFFQALFRKPARQNEDFHGLAYIAILPSIVVSFLNPFSSHGGAGSLSWLVFFGGVGVYAVFYRRFLEGGPGDTNPDSDSNPGYTVH